MKRLAVIAVCAAWASTCAAQLVEVRMSDTSGMVTASVAGTPFIRAEMLQLVDNREGWRVVYSTGAGTDTVTLGDGTREFTQRVDDTITVDKSVEVAEGSLRVATRYTVEANVDANQNYYFVDIPAEAVEGALLTTVADGQTGTQILRPAQGTGTRLDALTECTFLTEAAEVHFALEAEHADWLFMDWTNTEHGSYRLRVERPVDPAGFTVRLAFTMTVKPSTPARLTDAVAKIEADERARREKRLADLRIVERKPLAIRSVTASAKRAPVHEKLELTIDMSGTWDNPFDPDDIEVSGRFKQPDGTSIDVPGFLNQPAADTPVWMIRYAPTHTGSHGYVVRARDRTGETASAEGTFEAADRLGRGFVRIGKDRPLSLAFDSGEPYFPIGINHFTWTRLGQPVPADRLEKLSRYLDRLADNGGNYLRLRMDSWWVSIEGSPDDATGYLGVGKFHQPTARIIDQVFDLAHERDCYIQLCLYNPNGNINNPKEPWRQIYNMFMKEHGGPLDDISAFWTDADCDKLVRAKLRYCVARWGYSQNLMAWEFFNEIVIRPELADETIAWHDRMSTYLREIDPWDHLITTSPMGNSWDASDALWKLPDLDIVQVHNYELTDMGNGMAEFCREAVERHQKPFIVGEFGLPRRAIESGGLKLDPDGLHLHNGLWSSALSGAAGTAMHWYIESYIDRNDLYGQFAGLSTFMQRFAGDVGQLSPIGVTDFHYVTPPEPEVFSDVSFTGHPRFAKARASEFTANHDGTLTNADQLGGYLWGTAAHSDLRNPPTFTVDFRQAGQFILHVAAVVGNGDGPTRVYLDGELALEENLAAGEGLGKSATHIEQYDNWLVAYDRDLAIDVPAGRHEIRCEHAGKDRAEVRYRLIGYVSSRDVIPLRAIALGSGAKALLWLQNTKSSYQARADGIELTPVPPTEISVLGLADGTYTIEFISTADGSTVSTLEANSIGGPLTVRLPEIETDIACAITRP